MNIHIKFPPPHSEIQRTIFKALSTPGLIETWVACGSKFGKTISGSVALAKALMSRKQGRFRWVAPTYSQALIGRTNISRILPPEPYVHSRQYAIEVPLLQSRIDFKSGDKPENLEGEAIHGYVLDEYAKQREQVYASAKTTVTLTRGPMLILSTPRGRNHFYKKCMEAKEQMTWALANDKPITKMFIAAPTSANPMITAASIEDARRSLPDRLFRQYYLGEFVEDSTTFVGFRDCYITDLIERYEEHQFWFHPDAKESDVVIGADWAKTVDWTVFIAICYKTNRVLGFERFHKRPYTDAVKQLIRFSAKFREVGTIYHDKTGVGQAIDDQLAYTNLPFKGITFSNRSKTDMVNQLITRIERQDIGLCHWNVLDLELDSYEVTTNDLGTMTYSAPSGHHDDAVCALMLANAALDEYSERDMDVRFLEDLKNDMTLDNDPMANYYNDLIEDED